MNDVKETKLLIHKNTLLKMLYEAENEINYYSWRYKRSVFEPSKSQWKDAIKQHKAEYEALDYAIELIKKELGEVEL